MKKRIFFAMLISAFAAGAFLVSCDDDDDDDAKTSGCSCTAYYDGEEVTSVEFSAEEMKAADYSSCSELAEDLEYETGDPDITYECR